LPKSTQKKKSDKPQINTLPLYALLVVLFALYILFQHGAVLSVIIGVALFLTLITVICVETINGIKKEGLWKNLLEIVIVVAIVFGVWFAMQFFLSTRYPLDVVPSCSMLPTLQRGDMLLLHGVTSPAQLKAPIINIDNSTYSQVLKEIPGGLSCVAYMDTGNGARISQYMEPGYSIGLYSAANGGSIVNVDGQNGPLKYECGVTNSTFSNGTVERIVYTSGISLAGQTINGDRNNSIVVYATIPKDLFYQEGDSYIVHRAYAILNVSGSYYVLTKGDNNPGLDIQYSNYPAPLSYIQGKVVASIPYLGYLKLILSSRFTEPAGCNSTIQN
jgi:signal peptidase I